MGWPSMVRSTHSKGPGMAWARSSQPTPVPATGQWSSARQSAGRSSSRPLSPNSIASWANPAAAVLTAGIAAAGTAGVVVVGAADGAEVDEHEASSSAVVISVVFLRPGTPTPRRS